MLTDLCQILLMCSVRTTVSSCHVAHKILTTNKTLAYCAFGADCGMTATTDLISLEMRQKISLASIASVIT